MTEYERWLAQNLEDPDLTEELQSIRDNPAEINDRFYRDLEFGTGGLRGVSEQAPTGSIFTRSAKQPRVSQTI